jgi:APA family basic amino acid/polyamine antiporter
MPAAEPADTSRDLVRGLGTWDATLLTIGSVIGTGIFITTADIARVLPNPALILLVWVAGGLLTLAGALSYAELGALFPRAGGIYHYLKEAYGPLWGFLYGWTCFLVILSGGIAALAVAFGEYLGSFLPFFSTRNILLGVPLAGYEWTVSGGQLAATGAIVVLTAVNYVGLRQGAGLQNLLTVIKVGSIALFVVFGFFVKESFELVAEGPLPIGNLFAAFGVGMIAVLWTYDGWYGTTFSAGEMRRPRRDLPHGLIWGTAIIMLLYVGLNVVYLRALPLSEIAATPRIGETAAVALFGSGAGRLVSAAVLVSTFGCLAATILYSPRIYLAMARDGLFFRSLAEVHPKYRTPGRSLWAQSAWAIVLTLSGTYEQLYTYVVVAAVLFHVATGAAVFVLRRKRPELERPYRTWGYPWVPAVFIVASVLLLGNALLEKPVESLLGLALVALGLPAFSRWRRRMGNVAVTRS